MDSVALKLESPQVAKELKELIQNTGTNLTVSLMNAEAQDLQALRQRGGSIMDNLDGLLVIGDKEDIDKTLTKFVGADWEQRVAIPSSN